MFTVVFHRHFSCRQIRDTAELTKVKCVSGVHSLEAASVSIWQPVYNNNSKKKNKKKNLPDTREHTKSNSYDGDSLSHWSTRTNTHTLLSHTQRQKVKNTAESIYQDISWQQPSKHISVPKRFDHSSPRVFHFIAKAVWAGHFWIRRQIWV